MENNLKPQLNPQLKHLALLKEQTEALKLKLLELKKKNRDIYEK